MALDRVVTLHIGSPGMRVEGEWVPGPVTDVQVWAQTTGTGYTEQPSEAGGFLRLAHKDFLIRWRQDVLTAGTVLMEITDDYGTRFSIQTITDSGLRRRFLSLSGIEEVTR